MAETDYSLISGISQQSDPIRKAGQVFELKDLINQEQMGELKVNQAKQQAADMAAAKKALHGIDISTPEGQHQAAQALNKIDPALGMDFLKQTADLSKSQNSVTDEQLDIWGKQNDIIAGAANQLLQQYSSMVGANPPGSPADTQARAKMQGQYQQMIQQLSQAKLPNGQPVLDRNHLSMIVANPQFDPGFIQGIIQQSNKGKQLIQQQIDQKKLGLAERSQDTKDAAEKSTEELHQAEIKNLNAKASDAQPASANKWQVLTDPKDNTQYRYNPETAQATTLDGKPYSPSGAKKIDSGSMRSPQTAAMVKFLEENPNATSEQVSQFAAKLHEQSKAAGDFGSGKQGQAINSFNVAISHLSTMEKMVNALGNGNAQAFNRLSNYYAQQTGKPAPTNFDTAKAIVGDEIIKAILGGGGSGALADRENAQNQISSAKSPQQLMGVISTYKELMGGQLRGLKKQYEQTTGFNDFDSRLAPETRSALGDTDTAQTAAPAATGPAPATGKVVEWHNLP